MTARRLARAVARQVVPPPPHVREFLVAAATPTASDIEHVREAVLLVLAALAVLAALNGCSR